MRAGSRMVSLLLAGALLASPTPFAAAQAPVAAGELDSLARFRAYKSRRISSHDRAGANDDGQWKSPIKAGETRELADIAGAGVIKHMWFTINSGERHHLKRIVLRMYWDGERTPSVEAPIGDFFGLGLGEYFTYESKPLSVGSQNALNCYFQMPYSRGARITVTNEGREDVRAFYYNFDYEEHESIPADLGRFHAQYRQAAPTKGWTNEWQRNGEPKINDRPNPKGEGNYVILEAEGRGHYVGVTHSILQNQADWWGEGDDMMFIDGEETPSIIGTGAEDYYLGAWCYGGCGGTGRPTFAFERYGNPMNGGDDRNAKWMVYRYHLESPVTFTKSLRVTIEAGHANHRSDNYYTVAFWYQAEPHGAFPALPPVEDRIPRLRPTGGPEVRP
jgi:hypothetical protein